MPELPEVETVKRGLEPLLKTRVIERVETRRAGLRFTFPKGFVERLAGKRVIGLSRRAKYILVSLEDDLSLLVHLGMTGRFTVLSPKGVSNLGEFYFEAGAGEGGDGPHDHVVFHLQDGIRLVYSDPRRFGMMDLLISTEAAQHKLLKDIGVEPLGNELSADYLVAKFKGKAAPMKAALLDQRIIAGLGNIYVCEVLFRSRISPKRKAGKVKPAQLEELVRHVRDILNEAILAGGSTLQDFQSTHGEQGSYQQRFQVYDREGEPCVTCGKPIKRMVQSGRSSFYCASCQR
ncbi:MAG: bifunctional DNA-formamidopyrimidine glycosylase/DNA-(apurinic or apyrimidinic site) lyase [Aestuariivirga sp.]